MNFSGPVLLERMMMLIPLLLSLTVHEFAHAWSAYLLGDDTAARQGRLTLNPIAHIDPLGTLLLPLLGIPFGWAKPVPVNSAGFRRDISMSTGMMITAAAGPISNLILSVLCAVAYGLLLRWSPDWLMRTDAIRFLLSYGIMVNVSLALFNMLPVPPLDGSRVVDGLLPYRFRQTWASIQQYAPFALLGVMFFGGRLIAGPAMFVQAALVDLIRTIGT